MAVIETIERATELKYSIIRSSRYAIQGRMDIRVIKNGCRMNAETIRGDLEFSGVRIYESRQQGKEPHERKRMLAESRINRRCSKIAVADPR